MNLHSAMLAFLPGGQEWIGILVVVLILVLLFGAKRIPDLARSIGQSIKEFKKGVKSSESEEKPTAKPAEPKKGNGQ